MSLQAAGVKGTPDAQIAAADWRMGAPVRFALLALLSIVAFDALHELFGLAGSRYSNLIDSYFYDLAATGAAITPVRGLAERDDRGWVLLALGTFSWVLGDILSDFKHRKRQRRFRVRRVLAGAVPACVRGADDARPRPLQGF